MHNKKTNGYIALSSMLVILAVVLVIGTSVALLSVSNAQLSLAQNKNSDSLDLTESCVEEALIKLNETNNIPGSITLPAATCSVSIDAQTGSSWTFTVSADHETYHKSIQVIADRSAKVTVSSWKEI